MLVHVRRRAAVDLASPRCTLTAPHRLALPLKGNVVRLLSLGILLLVVMDNAAVCLVHTEKSGFPCLMHRMLPARLLAALHVRADELLLLLVDGTLLHVRFGDEGGEGTLLEERALLGDDDDAELDVNDVAMDASDPLLDGVAVVLLPGFRRLVAAAGANRGRIVQLEPDPALKLCAIAVRGRTVLASALGGPMMLVWRLDKDGSQASPFLRIVRGMPHFLTISSIAFAPSEPLRFFTAGWDNTVAAFALDETQWPEAPFPEVRPPAPVQALWHDDSLVGDANNVAVDADAGIVCAMDTGNWSLVRYDQETGESLRPIATRTFAAHGGLVLRNRFERGGIDLAVPSTGTSLSISQAAESHAVLHAHRVFFTASPSELHSLDIVDAS